MKYLNLKKIINVVILSIGFFVFSQAMAVKQYTIKYSDHDPSTGMRPQFLQNVWFKEITTVSSKDDFKFNIQPFWGGSLMSADESLKGIADGVVDMGLVYPDFYPNQLPLHQIFRLFPTGPADWKHLSKFYADVYKDIPELSQELARNNQKILLITAGLPAAFLSAKPIVKISDLNGKKWRASNRWVLNFLKNNKAQPVSVPWADCYMALQTGTIDGVFTNLDGAHMTKLDEAAPNILLSKSLWMATPFIHTVNIDYWNSLSKPAQDKILAATKHAGEEFGKAFDKTLADIVADERKSGYKVVEMSNADVTQWVNQSNYKELQKQWVDEAKKNGIKNADKILIEVEKLHDEAMQK